MTETFQWCEPCRVLLRRRRAWILDPDPTRRMPVADICDDCVARITDILRSGREITWLPEEPS
jgi:hypothetical protein